jgi:hypothetical protein
VMRSIERRRVALQLQQYAALAGRLDEAGELGRLGMALVAGARRAAVQAGVPACDIDDHILDGLDEGRATRCP